MANDVLLFTILRLYTSDGSKTVITEAAGADLTGVGLHFSTRGPLMCPQGYSKWATGKSGAYGGHSKIPGSTVRKQGYGWKKA